MKTIIVLVCFLSSAIAACGRAPVVNSDLQSGMSRYLAQAPNSGHIDELISVDWGQPPGTALGQCIVTPDWHGGHSRKVRILRVDGMAPVLVETLVAHELAHCLHDKVHDDSSFPKLMNTHLVEEEDYWTSNLDADIRAIF